MRGDTENQGRADAYDLTQAPRSLPSIWGREISTSDKEANSRRHCVDDSKEEVTPRIQPDFRGQGGHFWFKGQGRLLSGEDVGL